MRLYFALCVAIVSLFVLTGCTVTSVDGKDFIVVAPSATDTSDAVDEFYEGLFAGCIRSLIVNNDGKALSPEINKLIVRQCMVVTAGAIKNDSHQSGVPGWPGVEEIRRVLKGMEGDQQLDLLGSVDL